ncbi:hypothetical protein NDU88_010073 [Pleurodeles waltl]|uniref:Uncharacterized protein n=1 Tax=Pleurodeles waltl TaxID=8319 RepID=A0AAV7QVC0_PLEWA|nr:hypothetical protein NDU88_010073 [Pleurodeles waltl]
MKNFSPVVALEEEPKEPKHMDMLKEPDERPEHHSKSPKKPNEVAESFQKPKSLEMPDAQVYWLVGET